MLLIPTPGLVQIHVHTLCVLFQQRYTEYLLTATTNVLSWNNARLETFPPRERKTQTGES